MPVPVNEKRFAAVRLDFIFGMSGKLQSPSPAPRRRKPAVYSQCVASCATPSRADQACVPTASACRTPRRGARWPNTSATQGPILPVDKLAAPRAGARRQRPRPAGRASPTAPPGRLAPDAAGVPGPARSADRRGYWQGSGRRDASGGPRGGHSRRRTPPGTWLATPLSRALSRATRTAIGSLSTASTLAGQHFARRSPSTPEPQPTSRTRLNRRRRASGRWQRGRPGWSRARPSRRRGRRRSRSPRRRQGRRAGMGAVHDESSGGDRRQPELGRARPFLRFDPLDGDALDPNAGCAGLRRATASGVGRIAEQQIDRQPRGSAVASSSISNRETLSASSSSASEHLRHGGSDGDDAGRHRSGSAPCVRVRRAGRSCR